MKDIIEIDGVKYKRLEEEKPRGLYLKVDDDKDLCIKYKDDFVGYIQGKGKCFILSDEAYIKTYEQWREDGMPVDTTPVEWKGGNYQILQVFKQLIRMDKSCGDIYDFEHCCALEGCEDKNIVRFKHNNRPILF